MALPALTETRLVGGTSLALQLGHRQSEDIDLFGTLRADEFELFSQVNSLGDVILIQNTSNIKVWTINGIKFDLVNYPYPWLEEMITTKNLRLAGKKDIAAMKLAAITGRGARKDFIDIYFLLQEFSLGEMLRLYLNKYRDGSIMLVLKSLLYFNDAELEMESVMLTPIKWARIKSTISALVEEYIDRNSQ
jgi:hypothetical protein